MLALLIANLIVAYLLSIHYHLVPGMIQTESANFMHDYYVKPYVRAGAYLVGVLFAFAYHPYEEAAETSHLPVPHKLFGTS